MKKILNTAVVASLAIVSVNAEGWEQSFDLGATVSKGNSDSVLATAGYAAKKVEEKNEYAVAAFYTYGEEDDTTTNDEFLAAAGWNHLYTDRAYAGVRGDVRADALADIDYRATLSLVGGYYFLKNDTTYFAVEAGPGYTVEQTGGENDEYASLYIGQKFEHKFSEKTRIYQTVAYTAPFEDIDDYSIVFEAGLETFLSDTLSLKVSVQDKHEAIPVEGLDKNDFKLITGISYKF